MDTMSEALVKYKSVEDNPCRVISLIKVAEHQDKGWE